MAIGMYFRPEGMTKDTYDEVIRRLDDAGAGSPPGRTLQTAAPVSIVDLPNDSEFRLSPLLRDHGVISVLNVPVMIDGRCWGVLEIDSEEPRAFDDADVGFLSTLANMVGMALARQGAERKAVEILEETAKKQVIWKTLVRELQHRTKNNLQTVVSFVAQQRKGAGSEETKRRLTSVMGRVHAIALAHDQLSFAEGISHVDFGEYLRSLCANIDPFAERGNAIRS